MSPNVLKKITFSTYEKARKIRNAKPRNNVLLFGSKQADTPRELEQTRKRVIPILYKNVKSKRQDDGDPAGALESVFSFPEIP